MQTPVSFRETPNGRLTHSKPHLGVEPLRAHLAPHRQRVLARFHALHVHAGQFQEVAFAVTRRCRQSHPRDRLAPVRQLPIQRHRRSQAAHRQKERDEFVDREGAIGSRQQPEFRQPQRVFDAISRKRRPPLPRTGIASPM